MESDDGHFLDNCSKVIYSQYFFSVANRSFYLTKETKIKKKRHCFYIVTVRGSIIQIRLTPDCFLYEVLKKCFLEEIHILTPFKNFSITITFIYQVDFYLLCS